MRQKPAAADFLSDGPHGDVSLGQIQGESAALPDGAGEADFTTEQSGNLAADGQTEPGAAVFATGAAIGLLERLEDDLLLLGVDADASVAYREGNYATSAIEVFIVQTPAFGDG